MPNGLPEPAMQPLHPDKPEPPIVAGDVWVKKATAYSPSLRYRIRTSDGALLERKGPCTDRQGFAVYMISLLGDQPTKDTPVANAVRALLDACGTALAIEKDA